MGRLRRKPPVRDDGQRHRLSSRETLFLKYCLAPALAALWLACYVMAMLGKLTINGAPATPGGATLLLGFGLGFAYFIHHNFGSLKNVWLEKDELFISNGFRSEQVHIDSVIDVPQSLHRRHLVWCSIKFDRETAFGSSIAFVASPRQARSPAMLRLTVMARWNDRRRHRRQTAATKLQA